MNDPDRGEVQTAYEVVVRELPIGGGVGQLVWDSGEVHSDQQSYVTPADVCARSRPLVLVDGPHVGSRRTRSGRTRTPAHFDIGLRDHDWHADWIRRPGAEQQLFEDFSLFRKEFTVTPSPIVRARAYMSAGQQYDLRVNGVRVAHGPSFAYPDEQYYETTDITKQLVAGHLNAIGVVTHWSTPGQGRPASVPAFIAHITIDHADGTRQVITSDGPWRTHTGPWMQGPPRNDEGDFVEHVDGRLEPVGWDRPASTTAAGRRPRCSARIPSRRSCTSTRSAATSSSTRCSRSTLQAPVRRRVRGRLRLGDRGDARGRAPRRASPAAR